MGIEMYGADRVIAMLRNMAIKVPDNASRTMHSGADKIVDRAKLFCPRDTGALEDSIHQETTYGTRRRLQIDVIAGEGLDYATLIHENYNELFPIPGPNTRLKMEQNPGVDIGEKFLTRAADEQAPRMATKIIEIVEAIVKDEMSKRMNV